MSRPPDMHSTIETLRWVGDEQGYLVLIDQSRLPVELVERECRDVESVWEAIKQLRVRGAPAIGIAAAYGVVLGLVGWDKLAGHRAVGVVGERRPAEINDHAFFARLDHVASYLA